MPLFLSEDNQNVYKLCKCDPMQCFEKKIFFGTLALGTKKEMQNVVRRYSYRSVLSVIRLKMEVKTKMDLISLE
jgi:hypothetical protein